MNDDEEEEEDATQGTQARAGDDDDDDDDDAPAERSGKKAKKAKAAADNDDDDDAKDGDDFDFDRDDEVFDEDDSDDDMSVDKGPKGEAGIIHKIHVWNFMNHRELELEFNKSITFIHGPNGSGKSAVLAALQICLGARANVTHRGTLAGLVRRNADGGHTGTAKVQVTLLNGGSDAYSPELYGRRITIERSFNATGKSDFKLMNEKGQTVAKKREDLVSMLDRLNIQVENPVCILDQENSKEFIKGNEKDKYKFFAKATDLQRAREDLSDTRGHIDFCRKTVAKSKKDLRHIAVDLEKARDDLRRLQKVLGVDGQIKMYECALFWVNVKEEEDTLEALQSKIETIEGKVKSAKVKVEKAKVAMESEKSPEELVADIERLQATNEEASRNIDRLNKEIATASKPAKNAEKEVQAAKNKIKDAKLEMKDVQKKIDDAEEERKKHGGEEERKRQEALDAAKAEVQTLRDQIASAGDSRQPLKEAMEETKLQAEERKQEYEEGGQSLREAKAARLGLQQQKASPLASFGSKVQQVLKLIQQHKSRFDQEPVGPVGKHVTLKPGMQKYSKPISALIGGNLRSFLVSSAKDNKLLRELMTKVGAEKEHPVVNMRFAGRFGSAGQPQLRTVTPDLLTVERAIQVNNDVAFNYLCEMASIENCVLADTPEDAEEKIITGTKGNLSLVQGAQKGFDLTGAYTSVRARNKFYIRYHGRTLTFGTDVSQQLAEVEAEVQQAEQKQGSLKDAMQLAMKSAHGARSDFEANLKAEKEIRRQLKKAEEKVAKCSEFLQELEAETGIDTSDYEEELKELQTQLDECQEEIKEAMQRKKDADDVVNEKIAEKKTFEKSAADLTKKIVKAEDAISSLMREADQKKKKYEKALEVEETLTNAVEQLMADKEAQEKEVAGASQDATKYTLQNLPADKLEKLGDDARINTNERDAVYFQNKIIALEKRKQRDLEELPEGQRDLDAALHKAAKAKQVYDDKMHDIEKVQDNFDRLRTDLIARLKKWKKFRGKISFNTDKAFDKCLQQKGQSGELVFDHENKELNLTVQKDNRDTQSQIGNVKLLSGGERSYTTLALLMSLGDALETPFRIMDEFDVFMDSVSRKVK
jgi:chromosome segregation ATPase